MPSPLDSLVGVSLSAEPPDANEFEGLKASGLARLKDAANPANSLPSRFDLADNAAHALCLAALRYRGYRPEKRYIVFQVLPHTLSLGPEIWRVLAKAHGLRNTGQGARGRSRLFSVKPSPSGVGMTRTVPRVPETLPIPASAICSPVTAPARQWGAYATCVYT